MYPLFQKRKGGVSIPALLPILAAALLLFGGGCASTPSPDEEPEQEVPATPQAFRFARPADYSPDITNAAPVVLAADVNRTLTPKPAPKPTATKSGPALPKTTSPQKKTKAAVPKIIPPPLLSGPIDKAWNLDLTLGNRRAFLNDTQIWLLEPTVAVKSKKRSAKPLIEATENDRRYTLGPLFYAPTNAPIATNRPVRVFLDPGHGGTDSGATYYRRKESDITLDIARRLSTLLQRAGYEVCLSRTNDTATLSLEDRTDLAARWKADLFVSIHLNASTSSSPTGIETYAMPPAGTLSTDVASKSTITATDRANAQKAELGNCNDVQNMRLAWCVHRRLVAATTRPDRGIRRARYSVLREATMPAILTEVGFLSNPNEAYVLGSPTGRDKIALGLCRGIMDYTLGRFSPALAALPIEPRAAKTVPATAKPPAHE